MMNLSDVGWSRGAQPNPTPSEAVSRIAQRVHALSGECEECKNFRAEITRLVALSSSNLAGDKRKEHDAGLARVKHHLYRRHHLVVERHYIKRFVSMATVMGVGLIGLGYILFVLGVTVIVLALAVPALFGRLVVSCMAGLYFDRRAKKRGAVI